MNVAEDRLHSIMRRSCKERADGFTLVELMITVAVLAVIASLATPSFTNLLRSNRLTSSANEMVALLQTARVAAISNRASGSVCPTTDGENCDASLGNRWIALITKNGVTTILREATLSRSLVVTASENLTAGDNVFSFSPDGFSAVGTKITGVLGLCIENLPGDNGIDVSASAGRISTARRAVTSNCIPPEDS